MIALAFIVALKHDLQSRGELSAMGIYICRRRGFMPCKLKHHKMQTARGKFPPTGLVYFSVTLQTITAKAGSYDIWLVHGFVGRSEF